MEKSTIFDIFGALFSEKWGFFGLGSKKLVQKVKFFYIIKMYKKGHVQKTKNREIWCAILDY